MITAFVGSMFLVGCGSSSGSSGADRCVPATAAAVATVSDGLNGGAKFAPGAVMVLTKTNEQSSSGWPKAIVAARLTGGGSSGVATWAVGDPSTAAQMSPIMALSSPAQEWSNWMAAAQPGSQAAKNRDSIMGFEAAKIIAGCVE